MKTNNQGFGQGYRGIGIQNSYTPTPSLNRQSQCVSTKYKYFLSIAGVYRTDAPYIWDISYLSANP